MNNANNQPAQVVNEWKCGNEFLPYHPDASHADPQYRTGWNHCYEAAQAQIEHLQKQVAMFRAMALEAAVLASGHKSVQEWVSTNIEGASMLSVITDDMRLAAAKVLLPHLFRHGLQGQPKDGPETRQRMADTLKTVDAMLGAVLGVAAGQSPSQAHDQMASNRTGIADINDLKRSAQMALDSLEEITVNAGDFDFAPAYEGAKRRQAEAISALRRDLKLPGAEKASKPGRGQRS